MFKNGISPLIRQKLDDANKRLAPITSPATAQPRTGELPGIAAAPKLTLHHGELPTLLGSERQVVWANTIRNEALALKWPAEVYRKLCSITDATWWIANKTLPRNMKFKEPEAHQCAGYPAPSKAASPEADTSNRTPAQRSNDAAAWAHSVAQKPRLAEAAILAVLRRLYKDEAMRAALGQRATELLQVEMLSEGDTKDANAIKQMLTH